MLFKLIKILTFPIWFPLLLIWSIICLCIAISVFAIGFVGVLAFVIALLVGLLIITLGIGAFTLDAFTGFMGIGFSCILIGIAIIFAIFGIKICTNLVPLIFRKTKQLLGLPFKK